VRTQTELLPPLYRLPAARGCWGGSGKSSDEIWADVYYERTQLTLAITYSSDEKAATQVIDSGGVREAVKNFEQCLMYFPNHIKGIVGLSKMLLDFYEKVELGCRVGDGKPKEETQERVESSAISNAPSGTPANMQVSEHRRSSTTNATPSGSTLGKQLSNQVGEELEKPPENLNRLAARNWAYGLLSTLTRPGTV
jgi:hypothetical protein